MSWRVPEQEEDTFVVPVSLSNSCVIVDKLLYFAVSEFLIR